MHHFGIGYRHAVEDVRFALLGTLGNEARGRCVLLSLGNEMQEISDILRRPSIDALLGVAPGDARALSVAQGLRALLPGMDVGQIAASAAAVAHDARKALGGPPCPSQESLGFLDAILGAIADRDLVQGTAGLARMESRVH